MAESICSAATWLGVHDDGMAAMGQSNDTTFLRPITEGHVNALARPRHRGRTTWVWDVEITDDEGRSRSDPDDGGRRPRSGAPRLHRYGTGRNRGLPEYVFRRVTRPSPPERRS